MGDPTRTNYATKEPTLILSDRTIREYAVNNNMITPFVDGQVREEGISYGLSSFGYDARVADEFKVFRRVRDPWVHVVDPKAFRDDVLCEDVTTDDYVVIPPNSFVLGRTLEYFQIPRDILVVCLGKSTYARCGIVVNVTPLEPEWHGYVTMEFSNTTPYPAKLYANEGACQFLFFRGDRPCEVSYADRSGKYQGQHGVVTPRI